MLFSSKRMWEIHKLTHPILSVFNIHSRSFFGFRRNRLDFLRRSMAVSGLEFVHFAMQSASFSFFCPASFRRIDEKREPQIFLRSGGSIAKNSCYNKNEFERISL
jgi:hypothetical protein